LKCLIDKHFEKIAKQKQLSKVDKKEKEALEIDEIKIETNKDLEIKEEEEEP